MTTYIVLKKRIDGGPGWILIGQAESHSPLAAAREVAQEERGEYLAVPVRNATFVNLGCEPQPPKVTAVEVPASTYLAEQTTLDDPPDAEPVEAEAVA